MYSQCTVLFQDSLTMVESLARKHDGFEKTLESQVEKIDELQVFASQLVSGGHYDAGWVESKCQAIADRSVSKNHIDRMNCMHEPAYLNGQ